MGENLANKILKEHTVSYYDKSNMLCIKMDYTLTQDATGTLAYLEFMQMGKDKVQTELSVSYVDHNTLQNGFMNADDHRFLQTVANKYGIVFSKPGNGICHQVNLERFAVPGKTMIGSDSHTPTAGGMGMISIGAGGLDVACSMAGMPYSIVKPKIVGIELKGKLNNGVSAKDLILHMIRKLTVKGGVNKILEYYGDGVLSLTVPERATICNMGAEVGTTTSIFPSDDRTLEFLTLQGREKDYKRLIRDDDCTYDENITIDLKEIEPLAACPHSPDNVKTIKELSNIKVDQVLIGSCTNSSLSDLAKVASILKGKKVHKDVSLAISPGSSQVLKMITENGILKTLLDAGARILESACGPCIGMGQSPKTNAVSLRTFNRNFYARSGTESANVYLVSPETAASSAITGYITAAKDVDISQFDMNISYPQDSNLLIYPDFTGDVEMGPNIKQFPDLQPIGNDIEAKVMISLDDNITTDHIMPAGSKVLPYRSNIEKISEFVFMPVDSEFAKRCKENGGGVIVAKNNYGQGSSREHAAIAPRYLGIKAVIANSFARIHRKNLINFGILPIELGEKSFAADLYDDMNIKYDKDKISINNKTKNIELDIDNVLNDEEYELIQCGGLLNKIKQTK